MKNKITLLLCLVGLQFMGQTVLGVDTIYKSGPLDKRINVVIISEGFLASEMSVFTSKAASLTTYLFSQDPFKQYKKYFNVFAIRITSPQSGVSHPGTATDVTEPVIPVQSINNNFATTFDNNHTHRAIVSNNSSAVFAVLASNFPAYDQAVVLANSPEYGGTGGAYAVMSINSSAPETLVHEMGHSFAGLADEYWAGAGFANEKPNMTANSNTSTVKWSQWLGITSVGIYPYGTASPESNWFRPHQNCKMKVLSVPYCPVCRQTVIERIHSLTNPIDDYAPINNQNVQFAAASLWFKTKLVKPAPNTLRTTWEVNSTVRAHNADSLLVTDAMFSQGGSNSVVFTACDTTMYSKDTAHVNLHTYSVVWDVDYYSTTGVKEVKAKLELSVFPNPTSETLNVEYNLLESAEVAVSVTDMSGRVLISEKSRRAASGSYKKTIDVTGLAPGNYILALKLNDQTIHNNIVITK